MTNGISSTQKVFEKTNRNLMILNKKMCKAQHQVQNMPLSQHRLSSSCPSSSSAENILQAQGILQPVWLGTANCIMGYVRGVTPFSQEWGGQTCNIASSLEMHRSRGKQRDWSGCDERLLRWSGVWGYTAYDRTLVELHLLNLEKEKHLQLLKPRYKVDESMLFLTTIYDLAGDNRHKSCLGRFIQNFRTKIHPE